MAYPLELRVRSGTVRLLSCRMHMNDKTALRQTQEKISCPVRFLPLVRRLRRSNPQDALVYDRDVHGFDLLALKTKLSE